MSCNIGWCADCGDCLGCYGDEYCAITDLLHADQIPDPEEDEEPVATPIPGGVEGTPE